MRGGAGQGEAREADCRASPEVPQTGWVRRPTFAGWIERFVDLTDQIPPVFHRFAGWVELVDRASPSVRRHYELPADRLFASMRIAGNGTNAWVGQDRPGGDTCPSQRPSLLPTVWTNPSWWR